MADEHREQSGSGGSGLISRTIRVTPETLTRKAVDLDTNASDVMLLTTHMTEKALELTGRMRRSPVCFCDQIQNSAGYHQSIYAASAETCLESENHRRPVRSCGNRGERFIQRAPGQYFLIPGSS